MWGAVRPRNTKNGSSALWASIVSTVRRVSFGITSSARKSAWAGPRLSP